MGTEESARTRDQDLHQPLASAHRSGSKRSLIDPIPFVDAPPHEPNARIDRPVVLQRPSELPVRHSQEVRGPVHLDVEEGAERSVAPDVSPLLPDAEDDETSALGPSDAQPKEQLQESGGQELSVKVVDD